MKDIPSTPENVAIGKAILAKLGSQCARKLGISELGYCGEFHVSFRISRDRRSKKSGRCDMIQIRRDSASGTYDFRFVRINGKKHTVTAEMTGVERDEMFATIEKGTGIGYWTEPT